LPNNYVTALTIDTQGNIWIDTSLGLARFDGENWTVYKSKDIGLGFSTVLAFAIDPQGNI